jgi:sugar phosphate isomerase/epimerase
MTIFIADWSEFEQVLPIANQYRLGLEFQEFTNPANIENPENLVKKIKTSAKNLPELSMHGPFAELVPATWDLLVRQVVMKRFSQAYDIARETGARHLILHTGFIPKTYQRERWISNSYDFWMDFLKDKPENNFFHIENVYEDDFNPLVELVDKVNQVFGVDRLTINLDVGHVNANSRRSLQDWISTLGDRIRYAHLHNNGGILDDHWSLDRGTIDIARVLALLQAHCPRAAWSVETTLEGIQPSLEWLQRRGYLFKG